MCRGGESKPQSEVIEQQFKARWKPDEGQFKNAQQAAAPSERCLALPARALRGRVSSHSTPPTWAAWLPKHLQPKSLQQNPEAASTRSGSTDLTDLSGPWNMDTGFQQNVDGCCEDQLTSMPADMYVNPSSDQQFVYVYQPMLMPVSEVSDQTPWIPMEEGVQLSDQTQWIPIEEGVQLIPFDSWADANNAGMYYPEPQVGDCFVGQLEQAACQNELSMSMLTGSVWQLSKDAKGCRQVQDAFENAGDEERMALASELVGHVWEALKCMHANHVVQKCITTIRPSAAQFVIDELNQHGPKGIVQAAKHRFGCRILQRLLEQCTEEQMSPVVAVLLNDAVDLSSHTYGHYVMMHIFEQCGQDTVSTLASTLKQHLPNMIADGYIGGVIGKALIHTYNQACVSLAAGLLHEHVHMVTMACSRWGYLAVKQALQVVSPIEQEKALRQLWQCSAKLRLSRYGRLVSTFAAELQSNASHGGA